MDMLVRGSSRRCCSICHALHTARNARANDRFYELPLKLSCTLFDAASFPSNIQPFRFSIRETLGDTERERQRERERERERESCEEGELSVGKVARRRRYLPNICDLRSKSD